MARFHFAFIIFTFLQFSLCAQASTRVCGSGVLSTPTIFYQLEHEGQIVSPGFSKSGLFLYYRPVEMNSRIVEATIKDMSGLAYAVYRSKKILGLNPWNAFSDVSKKTYMEKLIEEEAKAKGVAAVWDNKTLLLMVRSEKAPAFLAKHPNFEFRSDQRSIANPEIVSDRESPASDISEVLKRSEKIIEQTGYKGIHYHAFTEMKTTFLATHAREVVSEMEAMNYKLALQAYARDGDNIYQANLSPWLEAKSERLGQDLVQLESKWPTRLRGESDTKEAFAALRLWERRGDNVLVSIELRGLLFPQKGQRVARVEGQVSAPSTDFSQSKQYLDQVERLLSAWRGGQVASPLTDLDLNVSVSSAALAAVQQTGRPDLKDKVERFFSAFSEINYSVKGEIHRGMLLPFVKIKGQPLSAASQSFITQLVKLIDTFESSGITPTLVFEVKSLYQDWARTQLSHVSPY